MMDRKLRLLVCTCTALASGFFGALVGGQISTAARTQSCEEQMRGLDMACRIWKMPGGARQGGTAGLWTGTIVGAFVAGSLTSPYANSNEADSDEDALVSWQQTQAWLSTVAQQQPPVTATLPKSRVREWLRQWGFSDKAIARGWKEIEKSEDNEG